MLTKRIAYWSKRVALLLLLLIAATVVAVIWLLRGSLPVLTGELALPGLSQPVTIQRDALGVVTIDAANESDAMRALGYVHAQERYFEMDLMRRTSAGELAELLGATAVTIDMRHRVHRMRARASENLDVIAGDKRPQLLAYSDGVNAGMADLSVRPWPYLLLGQRPQPWQPLDSALAGYAMYFNLQDPSNARELGLRNLEAHLPPTLLNLLSHDGTRWDAPLMGTARGDATLPNAEELDLGSLPAPTHAKPQSLDTRGIPGSNNFVVSDELTADGRTIVAVDMHARLTAPNIWFRARLRYADARAPSGQVDVSGFTLPGLPMIIVGSSGHVAWGFTNSYVDSLQWDPFCGGSDRDSCAELQKQTPIEEIIRVKGGEPIVLPVFDTPHGAVFANVTGEQPMLLRWTAFAADALNLELADLAIAHNLEDALATTARVGVPTANLVLADSAGRIAWTLIGPIDPMRASSGVAAARARLATIADPPSSRLWTANNRTLDGAALLEVGDGGYALGARAQQVRDALFAQQTFNERDLLAIQLDDRAVLLTPWWTLLRELAAASHAPSALRELADAASAWNGRASTDSVSYRIVRAWRLAVHARIADGLTAPAQAALGAAYVTPLLPHLEGIAWPLVTQRPPHLLSRRYPNWDALFEDAAKEVRDELSQQGPLSERTWGERNTAAICHSLAAALPTVVKGWLCMSPDQLPGDNAMPRVQGPAFGATQRMVVSPGHERDGIIHMPGGQSGHPLSPFWGAGHADWVAGHASPFLPGTTQFTLRLLPTTTAANSSP